MLGSSSEDSDGRKSGYGKELVHEKWQSEREGVMLELICESLPEWRELIVQGASLMIHWRKGKWERFIYETDNVHSYYKYTVNEELAGKCVYSEPTS